jgi:hypothetical protein
MGYSGDCAPGVERHIVKEEGEPFPKVQEEFGNNIWED